MNVALCAIAKNENLYIREWVEWYKNLGISKIFLYDNNDVDGERFEDVIGDYISQGFVELIDVRGTPYGMVYDENGVNMQNTCYYRCYENMVNDYEWVCFFDIDEFLCFKEGWNLKLFLDQKKFTNFGTILVACETYGDNDLVYYDDRPVMDRFNKPINEETHFVKSIVRTKDEIADKYSPHTHHMFKLVNKKVCYADGHEYTSVPNTFPYIPECICKECVCTLRHYKTKTIEEYLLRNVGRTWGKKPYDIIMTYEDCLEYFFRYNQKTPEKIEYIKNVENKYIDKNTNDENQVRVAVCAIARKENLYIREWVGWYKNLGISKIFLYDNNELDGERFEDVIGDYIESGFVEVIDVRGSEKGVTFDENKIGLQSKCYIDCYENKLSGFDWVCFFDIDEFLTIKDGWDLCSFLNQDIFTNKDTILIKSVIYDDNNLVHYDDRPVMKRFTHISKYKIYWVKSIVRTNKQIYDKNIKHLYHIFKLKGEKICFEDGFDIYRNHSERGKIFIKNENWVLYPDFISDNICIINHYTTKTIEEYLKRHIGRHWGEYFFKGVPRKSRDINDCLRAFLKYCDITPDKMEYIKSLGFSVNERSGLCNSKKRESLHKRMG